MAIQSLVVTICFLLSSAGIAVQAFEIRVPASTLKFRIEKTCSAILIGSDFIYSTDKVRAAFGSRWNPLRPRIQPSDMTAAEGLGLSRERLVLDVADETAAIDASTDIVFARNVESPRTHRLVFGHMGENRWRLENRKTLETLLSERAKVIWSELMYDIYGSVALIAEAETSEPESLKGRGAIVRNLSYAFASIIQFEARRMLEELKPYMRLNENEIPIPNFNIVAVLADSSVEMTVTENEISVSLPAVNLTIVQVPGSTPIR